MDQSESDLNPFFLNMWVMYSPSSALHDLCFSFRQISPLELSSTDCEFSWHVKWSLVLTAETEQFHTNEASLEQDGELTAFPAVHKHSIKWQKVMWLSHAGQPHCKWFDTAYSCSPCTAVALYSAGPTPPAQASSLNEPLTFHSIVLLRQSTALLSHNPAPTVWFAFILTGGMWWLMLALAAAVCSPGRWNDTWDHLDAVWSSPIWAETRQQCCLLHTLFSWRSRRRLGSMTMTDQWLLLVWKHPWGVLLFSSSHWYGESRYGTDTTHSD